SLFVPLCISTGGNSGSQAATLITRAMALGQVDYRDWYRVLRHEIAMGLVLGVTLGIFAFGRAALTPKSVRSSAPPRPEPFQVRVHQGEELVQRTIIEGSLWWKKETRVIDIPRGLQQSMVDE